MTLIYFLVLIGPLVTLHELGHFAVAKLTGVRVLVFSLGFGPRLFGFRRGDTDYRISAFPIGGYVRMYGDESQPDVPENERHYAFLDKPWAVKVAIAVAGPLVNLVFPIALFFGLNLGEHQVVAPVVGSVLPGEPAAQAGLRPGDRIQKVDGVVINDFDDLLREISARPARPVALEVERAGATVDLSVTPSSSPNPDPFSDEPVGRLGILAARHLAIVTVSANSLAAQAGVKTGDKVVAVNGVAVGDRDAFLAAFDAAGPSAPITLTLERAPSPETAPPTENGASTSSKPALQTLTATIAALPTETVPCPSLPSTEAPSTDAPSTDAPSTDAPACTPTTRLVSPPPFAVGERRFAVVADDLAVAAVAARVAATRVAVAESLASQWHRRGLALHDGTVAQVMPNTPAAARELQVGSDRVVAVDGAALASAIVFPTALRKDVDGIHVAGFVDDAGEGYVFAFRLQRSTEREFAGQKVFGMVPAVDVGGAVLVSEVRGAGDAFKKAVDDTGDAIVAIVGGFKLMFSGKVGLEQLGGPVMIASVANEAAKSGVEQFVALMAMFSVNLGLLNLLPIPVLDGGHIVIVTIEALRRKKLDPAQRNRVMLGGLLVVGAVMLVAGYNDITSLFR